jgi:hypothetical protein
LHHLADKPKEERSVLPQCQTFASPVLVAEIKKFYDQPPKDVSKMSDEN